MTTALPDKHYSGGHRATEVVEDQRTHGREISTKKCRQEPSSTELDGDMIHVPLGATRYVSQGKSIIRKIQ